jgi:hypothetical protein
MLLAVPLLLVLLVLIILLIFYITFSQELDESGSNSSQVLAHFFIGREKDVWLVAKLPTLHHVRDDGIEGSLALAEELRKLKKKELLVVS